MKILLLLPSLALAAAGPLVIGPQHIYDMVGDTGASHLVDEQSGGLDPKAGHGGTPTSVFPSTYNAMEYPYEAVIDLQAPHDITEVWYYDAAGVGTLSFATGSPGAWDSLPSVSTSQYDTWRSFPVNRRTRYLQVVATGTQAQVGEIVLYSDTAATIPDPVGLPAVATAPRPTLRQFMGVDGFVDDVPARLAPFGSVREYHNWEWDEGNGNASYPGFPNNQFGWNPSWVTGWSFDAFYDTLAARGVEADPTLQLDAPWVIAPDSNLNYRPVPAGADPNDPKSYRAHARWMYQYAARYGSRAVPADSLLLRSNNPKSSGLGLVHHMEDWNEPDKTWETAQGFFRPGELAAMISADVDGDHGALGPGFGMLQADPSMQVVMPGITKLDTTFLRPLLFSLVAARGDMPLDVLNFHHYCDDGGDQGAAHTTGISPEADSLRQKLERIVPWRDRWAPGRSIWLSEFGWDTQQKSTLRAPTIAPDDSLETQARWILRAFLEAYAAGIDRAHLFYTRDYNSADPTNFASSGLEFSPAKDSTGATTRVIKPSWYYLATLSHRLGSWIWDGDESGVPSGLTGERFRKPGTDSVAWAVWSPTANGTVVAGAKLSLGVASALRVDFARKDSLGVASSATASNGVVTADVGEKPILFFSSGVANSIVARKLTGKERVEAFDIQGHALGSYPDVQATMRGLPAGLSILRDGTGKTWREFLPDR